MTAPRLALVTAHYPPNFVSGGTLVPQRLARGLAQRGAQVGVFAGWIGDDRPPLSTWDEEDDAGVRVRWLANFNLWGDRRNYDNPEAAERFGAWLDETAPDLVNFHSLQTLGAGLLHQAADRGLPTVVTLHDLWWWCARQFLCDRDYRPCCLVVDAGTCACHVDRPFLEARDRFTVAALERADRLVAVSESTAAVATANGVDPARLTVIENGIVPGTAPDRGRARARTPDGPVRFVYAGGADRMKGIDVLLDAARNMATRPGWELVAYGCEKWAPEAAGLPVRIPPAYQPERLGEVLADADVLVVPSAMRETYSILTREALGAGVPVICTDSLGPEEVVKDDANGLIVPTADAASLAQAMSRVAEEPQLLERLRGGCEAVPVSTVDEQIDAYTAVYDQLLGEEPAAKRAARRIERVLFVVGIDGAPLRYRAWLPAEGLTSLGVHVDVRHYRHPDISALGERADAVVLYRVPATVQIEHFVAGVRRLGTPVVFDVDDLIFDPALADEIPALQILPADEAELWMHGVSRYRTTMEACDVFIGSTPMLCRHAAAVTGLPAFRFANGVGRRLGKLSDDALRRPRTPGPLRVGYLSGTDTHDHDWQLVEPALAEILRRRQDLEVWLVGRIEATGTLAPFADRIRRWPMQPWTELPALLRDLDVNLAPMVMPSRFNEAKSAIKWMEAALVETPTVASPTEPFREAIAPGVNGMLAVRADDWVAAVDGLLDDELLRRRLGVRARRDALLELAPAPQGRRYLQILGQVRCRPLGVSDWEPVSADEPFMPVELDPYEGPVPAANELRRRVDAFRRSLREEGVLVASRRAAGYARRRWTRAGS